MPRPAPIGKPRRGFVISKLTRGRRAKIAKMAADTPELGKAARTLASLALAKYRQDGTLGVRQGEQLRRALATAADALDWDSIGGSTADRTAAAASDVAEIAESGAELLESDLEELLAEKKGEVKEIARVVESVQKLAADPSASYPTEVEYSHTKRSPSGSLITKIETLTLNDAGEALAAAATLEKRMEGLAKLQGQMLEELKEKRRQVREMRLGLPGFVESSDGLVTELLTMPV